MIGSPPRATAARFHHSLRLGLYPTPCDRIPARRHGSITPHGWGEGGRENASEAARGRRSRRCRQAARAALRAVAELREREQSYRATTETVAGLRYGLKEHAC